jgi:hypothetical protein
VWVAEAVQEDIIEGRGTKPGMITWPSCPLHPQHPLWLQGRNLTPPSISRDEHDPVWTCVTSNRQIAELGRL